MELYAVYMHKTDIFKDIETVEKIGIQCSSVEVLRYADTEKAANKVRDDLHITDPINPGFATYNIAIVRLDNPLKAANYLNSALQAQLPFDNMAPIA